MVVLKIALLLFCATTIHGSESGVCDYSDSACTTKAANAAWPEEVKGSDPIQSITIEGETETLKYKFEKANLTGLAKCSIPELSLYPETSKVDYVISCDELYAEGYFDMSGKIGEKEVDGTGKITATRYDYLIIVNGTYSTSTGSDGLTYLNVDDYEMSFRCNDKVKYTADFTEDRGSSSDLITAMNDDWLTTETDVGFASMKDFMKYNLQNSNDYLKTVPLEEYFKQ